MKKTERSADLARIRLGVSRVRCQEESPMGVEQTTHARRVAEYVARRSGIKAPLLKFWKLMH